jgi:ribonuclease P protein component
MLARRFRLKSAKLFTRTLNSQRLGGTRFFAVFGLTHAAHIPLEARRPTRFGFIVSKKIHKRAVRRNKIRRRLREIVRRDLLSRHADLLAPFSTIVIVARDGSLVASYEELRAALLQVFRVNPGRPSGWSNPSSSASSAFTSG